MKCPECQHNQRRNREGLTCTRCQYKFCFDPKQPPKMTDGRWLGLLNKTSRNETHYYTVEQLITAYQHSQQKLSRQRLYALLWMSPFLGLAGGYVLNIFFELPFSLTSIVVAVVLVLWGLASKSPSRETLQPRVLQWLQQWIEKKGTPVRLVTKTSLEEPPPEWVEQDIYDYGIEKLLVVNRDLLVDLLVRNGVHTSNRLLIISESGYPEYILPHVHRYLIQSEDLPIYLLHDATGEHDSEAQIASVRQKLSDLELPVQSHPIIDLGIHAHQLPTLKPLSNLGYQQADGYVPLDAFPILLLTGVLIPCLSEQISLAELYARRDESSGGGGADGGDSYNDDYG